MKNVLILTYYFPPLGLGGTQRVAKFVKYLPDFGWRPIVVTVKPIAYWAMDRSLEQDVQAAKIIRTESLDPQRLLARIGKTAVTVRAGERKSGVYFINQKLLPFLFVPDSKILWHPFVKKVARQLWTTEKIDALMTSSPPHSVHLVGRSIVRKYKLPWLVDFRDGWAGSHIVHEPTRWQLKRNQRLQKKTVAAADAVVAVSRGIKETLKNNSDSNSRFHIIANGFDPDDFPVSSKPHAKFTLCYSGTINKFAEPQPFLDALVLLRENDPAQFENLDVQFVGFDAIGDFSEQVSKRKLQKCVQVLGHKQHSDAVAYISNADALLLIAKSRDVDTFIPGKTFEYFGARKPILAISNSRYTNELLFQYKLAHVVDSFEAPKIYLALQEFFRKKWYSINVNSSFVDQFNRRRQTEQLAHILNSIKS